MRSLQEQKDDVTLRENRKQMTPIFFPIRVFFKSLFQPNDLTDFYERNPKKQTGFWIYNLVLLVVWNASVIICSWNIAQHYSKVEFDSAVLVSIVTSLVLCLIPAMLTAAITKKNCLIGFSQGVNLGCISQIIIFILLYLDFVYKEEIVTSFGVFLLFCSIAIAGMRTQGLIVILILCILAAVIPGFKKSFNERSSITELPQIWPVLHDNKRMLIVQEPEMQPIYGYKFWEFVYFYKGFDRHFDYAPYKIFEVEKDSLKAITQEKILKMGAIYNDESIFAYKSEDTLIPEKISFYDTSSIEKFVFVNYPSEFNTSTWPLNLLDKSYCKYIRKPFTVDISNHFYSEYFSVLVTKFNSCDEDTPIKPVCVDSFTIPGIMMFQPAFDTSGTFAVQTNKAMVIYDPDAKHITKVNLPIEYEKKTHLPKNISAIPTLKIKPVIRGGIIYSISPNGEIFGVKVSTGDILFRVPFYSNYLFSARIWTFIVAFLNFLLPVSLLVIIGTYRLPIYLVEAIWQSVLSLKTHFYPSQNAFTKSPVFFDQINMLPLPFSKILLIRLASSDISIFNSNVSYMIRKTTQKRLAAITFISFHEQKTDHLLWCVRALLMNEHDVIINTLVRFAPSKSKVTRLLQAYKTIIEKNAEPVHLENLIVILHELTIAGYRGSTADYLVYKSLLQLWKCNQLRDIANTGNIAQQALAVREESFVGAACIDLFGLFSEISSELRNYDAVDNFRDKRYYLSEAQLKLFVLLKKAQEEIKEPERKMLLAIANNWQNTLTEESKVLGTSLTDNSVNVTNDC